MENQFQRPGNSGLPSGAFRNHVGLNEGLKWSYYLLDQCKDMGIKILRKDLEWKDVEKVKGHYDWEESDRYIEGCEARDIRVLFILGKTNKIYDPTDTPPIPGNYLWAPYAEFVKEAAQRYKGRNVLWETWNEPNVAWMWGSMTPSQFLQNLFGVAEIIRSIEVDATIIGPAVGEGLRFTGDNWCNQLLELLKRQGNLDKFWKTINAWTGHHYTPSAPDDLFIEGEEYYELQRKAMDCFGGNATPYCTGERGFTASTLPRQRYAFVGTEKRKADYYTRQCLWGIYKEPRGFTINYVTYSIYDCGKEIVDTEAGVAMKSMLDVLGDFKYKERIDLLDDKVVLLRFVKDSEERFAVWDRTNQEKELNIPVGAEKALAYDNEGKNYKAVGKRGSVLLRIGQSPRYIVPDR